MCYFAANYYGTNASMMITASHNPKEYNGFKFSYNGIHNAYGDSTKELYNIIINKDFITNDIPGTIKNVDIKDITECFLSVNVPIIAYGTGTAILSILNIGTYAVIKHNKIPNAVISDA